MVVRFNAGRRGFIRDVPSIHRSFIISYVCIEMRVLRMYERVHLARAELVLVIPMIPPLVFPIPFSHSRL